MTKKQAKCAARAAVINDGFARIGKIAYPYKPASSGGRVPQTALESMRDKTKAFGKQHDRKHQRRLTVQQSMRVIRSTLAQLSKAQAELAELKKVNETSLDNAIPL